MADKLSATEQLELYSLAALVKSATEKRNAGKPISKREIEAVAAMEARQKGIVEPPAPVQAMIEPTAIVRMIVALEPRVCDEGAIRDVLGDAATDSLTEVGGVFGVSNATVKHTWRPNGMPGDGKNRIFTWADIVIWFIKRNIGNETARGGDEFTARKREAETRAAEAEALIKERRADIVAGGHISLQVAISVVKAYANKFRDGLMGVSRKMQPAFPAKYAAELTEDLNREHRNLLTAFSEASVSDLRQAAEKWS